MVEVGRILRKCPKCKKKSFELRNVYAFRYWKCISCRIYQSVKPYETTEESLIRLRKLYKDD